MTAICVSLLILCDMDTLLFNVIVLIIVADIMMSINGVEFPFGDVNLALEPTTIPPDHHGLETTTSPNTESGSTFSVSDVAFDLPQLPPGFVETASIIHCACIAHSLDATTDGFVYSADGGKCWTSVIESPNPEVGDVTVKVGRRVSNVSGVSY